MIFVSNSDRDSVFERNAHRPETDAVTAFKGTRFPIFHVWSIQISSSGERGRRRERERQTDRERARGEREREKYRSSRLCR